MQSFPFQDALCLLILSLRSSWCVTDCLFLFPWLRVTRATAGSLLSNYLVRSHKNCGARILASHEAISASHSLKCAPCLRKLSEKPFHCCCNSSECFQPEESPYLVRAVRLELPARLGPGGSPIPHVSGHWQLCLLLLVVICSCIFIFGSCLEPQKAEHIRITIKLFPMTILKSMSECGLWTSVGTL